MIPTVIAVGEKNTYFIFDQYKFIDSNKIEEGTLLNSTNDSLDPLDYHLEKCGQGAFKTMECNAIQSFCPNEDDEENIWRARRELDDSVEEQRNLYEPAYFNGNNEMVKIFIQKCVICFER